MGKGQRHSKNAGIMGSEALTYAERKALGFGTVRERLGKDSQANFYDCRLTLQPAVDPVVTPQGYVFSREAILECLLQQKKAIKRKLEAWEKSNQEFQEKAAQKQAVEEEAKLIAFDRQNHMGLSGKTARNIQKAITAEAEAVIEGTDRQTKAVVAIKEQEGRMKDMKAFWIPSQVQEVKQQQDRPDTNTYCPASGKKLKLKDLVPVKFTKVKDGNGLYMDPVTHDTLINSNKLVVLVPTGDVMLEDTYNKCVKPDGVFGNPPVQIREKGVIKLQAGGTGFAAHDGEKVQATVHHLLGPGSGKADLRGQHQGPRSMGGLQFYN